MKNAFDTRDFQQWDELDTESDDYIQNMAQNKPVGSGWKEKTTLEKAVAIAMILKYVSVFVVLPIALIWLMFS